MRLPAASLKIRIYGIVGISFAAGLGLTLFLLVRQTRTTEEYQSILSESVGARSRARNAQVVFKGEVQQWQAALLRATDPVKLEQHALGRREHAARANAIVDSLRREATDPETRAIAERFLDAHHALDGEYESALDAVAASKGSNAAAVDQRTVDRDLASGAVLDTLLRHLSVSAAERIAAEDAYVAGSYRWSAGLALALLIGVSIFTVILVRWLTRPIDQLVRVAHAIGEGDLGHEVTHVATDEIGMLAEAFRRSLSYVRSMAAAADRVAHGDLSVVVVPRSDRDCLSHSFVGMTRQLTDLSAEVERLAVAVRAGDLSVAGRVSAFPGAYGDLLRSINEMMGMALTPLRQAATSLERLAARDLTTRLDGTFAGDHARIQTAFNVAAESLQVALGEVDLATTQVSAASGQIASGSQGLARGAAEQAATIEEVSAGLQEVSSMARSTADNASAARTLSDEARDVSTRGIEAMSRLGQAVERIHASSQSTARIVKTIDEIAFQTNLLALNAAVEAARAGDAGRGFAVVAEEVRNLAMRSAEAARNTADLIAENVRNADEGRTISTTVVENLGAIDQRVRRVVEVIAEIAAASGQQSQGIEQVGIAVEQMSGTTQGVAASSEESAAAAEELAAQAARLRQLVARFELASAGRRTAPTPRIVGGTGRGARERVPLAQATVMC